MKIDDVPKWMIGEGKIGHAIRWIDSGWTRTLCGIASPSYPAQDETPKRICRKCRERLKTADLREPSGGRVKVQEPAKLLGQLKLAGIEYVTSKNQWRLSDNGNVYKELSHAILDMTENKGNRR